MENIKIENFNQKLFNYFSKLNKQINLPIAVISLAITGLIIVQIGKYQLAGNRIKKGKIEYKKGNWRMAYRILFDNRQTSAFDKEACQMLGCMMYNRRGDILDYGEGADFWLTKAGVDDCPKMK
jgi:hypothetical protein